MVISDAKIIKLVRDNIPHLIPAGQWRYELLSQRGGAKNQMADKWLRHKLMEEVSEYLEDRKIDELADIVEAVFALAVHTHRTSPDEILERAERKREERGGYKELVILTIKKGENHD